MQEKQEKLLQTKWANDIKIGGERRNGGMKPLADPPRKIIHVVCSLAFNLYVMNCNALLTSLTDSRRQTAPATTQHTLARSLTRVWEPEGIWAMCSCSCGRLVSGLLPPPLYTWPEVCVPLPRHRKSWHLLTPLDAHAPYLLFTCSLSLNMRLSYSFLLFFFLDNMLFYFLVFFHSSFPKSLPLILPSIS